MLFQYKDRDVAGLVAAGRETSWNDWGTKMAASHYYGDELCIEAVIAVYDVSIHILTGGSGPGGAYDSHKGSETSNPPIWLGCALETHFYSLILDPSIPATLAADNINDCLSSSGHVVVRDLETRQVDNTGEIVDEVPNAPRVARWGVIGDARRVTRSSKTKM